MNQSELREKVMNTIQPMLPAGITLEKVDIVKLNDLHLRGISFQNGQVGSVFYVNDFDDGIKSVSEIADEMVTAFENNVDAPPAQMIEDIHKMQTLDNIKDHLIVTLVDISKNQEFLRNY